MKRGKRAGPEDVAWGGGKSMVDCPPRLEHHDLDAMELDAVQVPVVLVPTRDEHTSETLVPTGQEWVQHALRRDPRTQGDFPLISYMTEEYFPTLQGRAAAQTWQTAMGPTALRPQLRHVVGIGQSTALAPPSTTTQTSKGKNKAAGILASMGGQGGPQDKGRIMGDLVPMELRLTLLSKHLQYTADRIQAPRTARSELAAFAGPGAFTGRGSRGRGAAMRLGTPQFGPAGGYRNWTSRPTLEAFKKLHASFMIRHTLDEPVPSSGDPMSMASFRDMSAQTTKHRQHQMEALRGGTEDQPRVARMDDPVSYAYVCMMLVRPPAEKVKRGLVRLCRSGHQCMAKQLGPQKGYVCREFLLPSERRLTMEMLHAKVREPRRCFVCELWWLTDMVLMNQQREDAMQKRALNYFTVKVDTKRDFARAHLLPITHVGGRKTGIVGHVPAFATEHFEYPEEAMDDLQIVHYGLKEDKVAQGGSLYALRPVMLCASDFQ